MSSNSVLKPDVDYIPGRNAKLVLFCKTKILVFLKIVLFIERLRSCGLFYICVDKIDTQKRIWHAVLHSK